VNGARRPVILDCDPGLDDAVAILLACASPALEVRGITVVAGNQTLPKVLDNCLRLLSYAGLGQVPVAAGCAAPLLRPLRVAAEVHGESGLGGAQLPPTDLQPQPRHAVDFIAELLRTSVEPVTLIPTAPMTNIALLLQLHPELKPHIREIVFMGGAAGAGNVTPSAEFNAYTDPEALRIVLRSGLPITMVGLDVTHRALVTRAQRERIRGLGGRIAALVADLLDFYDVHGRARHGEGAPLHDPVAVAQVIQPGIVATRPAVVDVECHGELTVGRTVVDFHGVTGLAANVQVGVDVQAEQFIELVVEALRQYP